MNPSLSDSRVWMTTPYGHIHGLCAQTAVWAGCECLTEPEWGDMPYAVRMGHAEARSSVTRGQLGMDQRSEEPWCWYLKGPLSGYRVSSSCSEPPASVLGLNAIMPRRWSVCLAGFSAIFTIVTYPFSAFPWTVDLLCFLFWKYLYVKNIKVHIHIFILKY